VYKSILRQSGHGTILKEREEVVGTLISQITRRPRSPFQLRSLDSASRFLTNFDLYITLGLFIGVSDVTSLSFSLFQRDRKPFYYNFLRHIKMLQREVRSLFSLKP
jgi:hypothetical protein